MVVIAEQLPEAMFILFHEPQSPRPFGALPKVEMWNEKSGWTAVRGWNRRSVVASRDHALAADKVGDWDICRVASVAVRHDVKRWRLLDGRGREQVVERHALPDRVELRPFCDAMNVRLDCGLGERVEFSPCPLAELQSVEVKPKSPLEV